MNHILFQKCSSHNFIYTLFVTKYILIDVVNNVVENIDTEQIQKELDQLTIPNTNTNKFSVAYSEKLASTC